MSLGLKQSQMECTLIDVNSIQELPAILAVLKQHEPFDFLILRNFHLIHPSGNLREVYDFLFTQKQYKVVVWYHDAMDFQDHGILRRAWRLKRKLANGIVFCVDRPDVQTLLNQGQDAYHLPIAADASTFYFQNAPRYAGARRILACAISYVGSQIFAAPEPFESDDAFDYFFKMNLAVRLCHSYPATISFIHRHIEDLFCRPIANGHQFRDTLNSLKLGLSEIEAAAWEETYSYLNTYYSWWRLTKSIRYLVRQFGLKVYGGDHWKTFLPVVQASQRMTPRLHEAHMYSLFTASKLSFCFTKFQFASAVHERPLLILSAGGFPLTDYREDLDIMFSPQEIVSYQSSEERDDKIRYYTKEDSQRLAIAKAGRERLLRDHLYSHRMKAIVTIAAKTWGLSLSSHRLGTPKTALNLL